MTSFLPTPKKKGIRNRRLKLKRQKQTHKTNQPAKISNKQRQNQNSLKEGKYHLHKQTFWPFSKYYTLSWTTESFIFCTDVNIKMVLIQDCLIALISSLNIKMVLIQDCLIALISSLNIKMVLIQDCLTALISSLPLPPTGLLIQDTTKWCSWLL